MKIEKNYNFQIIKKNDDNFVNIKNDVEHIYDENYLDNNIVIDNKKIKRNENKKYIFYVCKSFKQNQIENNFINNNMKLNEDEDEEEKQ